MSEPITVIIADDHPMFRDGLRTLVGDTAGLQLVGEADDGQAAIALVLDLRPDVVLMDIRMPVVDGVEATRQILGERPETAILMLTMIEDDGAVFTALRAGARGYVLKGSPGADIVESIRIVASGRAILDSSVAGRMGRFFGRQQTAPAGTAFPHLSAREYEILGLISQGLDNHQIAARLVVSEKTVRNNVSNILAKLPVSTRAEAIARARDAGLP